MLTPELQVYCGVKFHWDTPCDDWSLSLFLSPLVSRSKSAASMVSAKETLAAVPSLSSEGDSQLDSPPPPAPPALAVGEEPRAPPPLLHPPLVTLLDFWSLHWI